MVRVSLLALGVSLSMSALAPQEADAQLRGREPVGSRRGGVVIPQDRRDGRINSRTDGRCYKDDRDEDSDSDRGRGRGYEKRSRRDRDDDDDRYEHRDRYENRDRRYDHGCDNERYGYERNRGHGPKFCRNGQGHPVYGMQWCRDKGWGGASLKNVGWEDVILRRPRGAARSDLGRSILMDVLGRTVYGRFDQQRYRLGTSAPLVGRWVDTSRGTILNLYAGGLQIAQILDRNGDGRADLVRVAQ